MKNKRWVLNLLLNYGSLVLIASSGIIINYIVAMSYTPDVMGRFNTISSWYLVCGQIGVFGIHQAVMKFSAHKLEDRPQILTSGLVAVLIFSFIIGILIQIFAYLFCSQGYQRGLMIMSATILPFSLNKVILGYLNGTEQMGLYAVLTSLRSIFLVTVAIILVWLNMNGDYLFLLYLLSEFIVLFFGIIMIHRCIDSKYIRSNYDKELIVYGMKIFPSMFSIEIKPKSPIFIMKLFFNDSIIGIYSFVLLFIEGFYQICIILRTNLNPIFARLMEISDFKSLYRLEAEIRKVIRYAACFIIAAVYGVFYLSCQFLSHEYWHGHTFLLATLIMISICSVEIIVVNCISFLGFPQKDSFIAFLSVIFDIGSYGLSCFVFGQAGLIIGSIISYLLYKSFILYYLKRYKII